MWHVGRRLNIDRGGRTNPVDFVGVNTYWRAARLYTRSSLGCLLGPRHLGRLAIRPHYRTASGRSAHGSEYSALGGTLGDFGARAVSGLGRGNGAQVLHALDGLGPACPGHWTILRYPARLGAGGLGAHRGA